MLCHALLGAAAGAVGAAALNIATYADMAIRGRAPSSLPADLAGALADKLGVDLSAPGGVPIAHNIAEVRSGRSWAM
jgi:hypothetical protein